MHKTISATEAVRRFSDLLNHVRFRGERYTIARGGKPIASLGPVESPSPRTLGELLGLLEQLPQLKEDARPFARDVERGARKAPGPPRRSPWV